ncbi:MAG: hypothetical protein IJU41_01390, partial [Clostridia bacterium]|nr:hypothetical protein [Clostridia bacterium]
FFAFLPLSFSLLTKAFLGAIIIPSDTEIGRRIERKPKRRAFLLLFWCAFFLFSGGKKDV